MAIKRLGISGLFNNIVLCRPRVGMAHGIMECWITGYVKRKKIYITENDSNITSGSL